MKKDSIVEVINLNELGFNVMLGDRFKVKYLGLEHHGVQLWVCERLSDGLIQHIEPYQVREVPENE